MTTLNSNVDETVVARIRKLMALTTDRGASEAEAALAAEHVQRLLVEHNLSMATVEASGGSADADGKRVREGVNHRQVYRWQRDLMYSIAKLHFCKVSMKFKSRLGSGPDIFNGYDLIGRAANVATTEAMFSYLVHTIERLAREEVNFDPTQYFTRYAHSFKQGCADRLMERLRRKRDEIVAENDRKAREKAARRQHPSYSGSTLPVIILTDFIQAEEDFNNDMHYGYPPGTTARRRAENEAEYARQQAEYEMRKASFMRRGFSAEIADFMARGFSEERAREIVEPKLEKPETEAQRRKRETREKREQERFWRRVNRENSRIDSVAYRKGMQAGNDVGLDPQVRQGGSGKKLS